MSRREKIGLVVLVVLLSTFIVTLVWTLRGSYKPSHDYSDSIFVKQRMINLRK